MKAVLIDTPRSADLIETDRPTPGEGELLVKVRATGVCGSDLSGYLGLHPYRVPPVVTGHEMAGEVVERGGAAEGFEIGDTVLVEPQTGCGECAYCRAGDYHLCRSKRVLGTRAWPGSFAEYVLIPPRCAYRVPDGLSLPAATLVEPFSVGLHAIAQAGGPSGATDARASRAFGPGATVAILGSGTIGLTLLIGVLESGPERVFCTDVRPFNLEMARSLGAAGVFDPSRIDAAQAVRDQTEGEGVDVCFVAAPAEGIFDQALAATRPGGEVVLVAMFDEPATVDLSLIQQRERRVIGTLMYTRKDFERAMELLPTVNDRLSKLITHHIGLEELPETLGALSRGEISHAVKVVVEMDVR